MVVFRDSVKTGGLTRCTCNLYEQRIKIDHIIR